VRSARYVVVRYTPDPGRNEQLNIGVIVWDERSREWALDGSAIERVVRENPALARDALHYLSPAIEDALRGVDVPSETALTKQLVSIVGPSVSISEARHTSVGDAPDDSLASTLERLLNRIVTPRRRSYSHGFDPVEAVAKNLRPLLRQRAVSQNHVFRKSQTGVRRTVDFFVNSGSNVALDALKLDLKRADEIRLRADAEAYKVFDVVSANPVKYFVYCEMSDDSDLSEANSSATKILKSAGSEVLFKAEAASSRLMRAATEHHAVTARH